jgi:S-adenosylmethionine:tRNA ribosyltransferase-isomerase
VLNNTRVIPSRLYGVTDTGAQVELLLLQQQGELRWTALARPGRKLMPGKIVKLSDDLSARILEHAERGERVIEFLGAADEGDLAQRLEALGHMPLPPYIKREDNELDRERYQTVFADRRGSVAAPTAGLHFTGHLIEQLREQEAAIAEVTLHVGLGTFQPIDREDFENHHLHAERYEISVASWKEIDTARRVLAVGTTSVRAIESVARTGRLSGETGLFLYPGAEFRKTGAMLTNFHLPQSSLLLLVCAFGGMELILKAYHHAVRARYRFYSYGDCMLIL